MDFTRRNLNAGASLAAPEERDLAAVGRPGREGILGGIRRQPECVGAADYLHVEIPVVLLLAVPGECHLTAIGRETRIEFGSGIGCQRHDDLGRCRFRRL